MEMLTEQTPSGSPQTITDRVEEIIQRVRFCPCCGEAMIFTPRLVCEHRDSPMDVKCQVYRSDGAWYAECLTFNLLSKGDSEVDAIRRLQVAMFSYIATVFKKGESTEGLIPRRAPWTSWVRYYSHEIFGRLAYLLGRKVPLMIRAVPIQDAEELRVSHCRS